MKWNIVTDSSCDLFDLEVPNESVSFSSVPFVINVGNKDFLDDSSLNTKELIDSMEMSDKAGHTSCPSPHTWYKQFKKADISIAITISGKLSGSYRSACVARNMIMDKYPDKRIVVIDSYSAGAEITLLVRKLCSFIVSEDDFDTVVDALKQYMNHTHVVFALSSFNNLIKSGRMNKLSGFIANKLGFWGIGIGSEQGTIKIKKKVRGSKKALEVILNDMKERGFSQGMVVISHCHNRKFAENLKNAIQEIWYNADVTIMPTRGLCSYYAEKGGLIVGF